MKLFSLLLTFILFSNLTYADRLQVSEMVIETGDKVVNGYKFVNQYADGFFTKLLTHINLLANGQVKKFELQNPPKDFYKFYASSYLLCSTEKGVCPEFLKTILEVDIINSKINGQASCPHSLRMWKSWIASDMEKRLNHRLKITDMQKVDTFNKEERRQYYKCRATIEDIIANDSESAKDFFAKRYSKNFKANNYIEKTYQYIQHKNQKKVNIYSEVGL